MFLTTATLSLARNSRELDLILQVSQENTDPSVGKQRIYCTTIASPVVAGSASSAFPEVARFVSINSAPSQNLKRRDERKAGYQTAEGLLWQFVPWHEDSSYALLRNHAHSDTAAWRTVSSHGKRKGYMLESAKMFQGNARRGAPAGFHLLFLTKLTVSSSDIPSLYVASQYPYTYVEPEPDRQVQYEFRMSPENPAWLTSNWPRLPEDTTTKRDVVYLSSLLIIPSCHNDTRWKPVLVLVAKRLEEGCDGVYRRTGVVLRGVELSVVMDDIGYCLKSERANE
jgi:hypothetical protein